MPFGGVLRRSPEDKKVKGEPVAIERGGGFCPMNLSPAQLSSLNRKTATTLSTHSWQM